MYSVMVPVADAASHVGRHVESFARHWVTTQVATARHAGSFGQLVALWQQFVSTQEMHEFGEVAMVDALKISDAAGQLPASVGNTTAPLSAPPRPASPRPDGLPPGIDALQETPLTGLHVPSSGGFVPLEDEQAANAARAATGPSRPTQEPSPDREERPVVVRGAITFSLLLTLAYSWAVAGVSVKRGTGVRAADRRTGSHQFGPVRGRGRLLRLRHPRRIRSN
jgi:hypothetical protein